MAQSTNGILVKYAVGTVSDGTFTKATTETSWHEIPDLTGIPALSGEPSMLDSTPLSETDQKQYIMGLKDNGGSMSYNAMLTSELVTAVDAAVTAYNGLTTGQILAFAIIFPAPLNKAYWYQGKPTKVLPGEGEVDVVLTTTFYTSIETAPSTSYASGSSPIAAAA